MTHLTQSRVTVISTPLTEQSLARFRWLADHGHALLEDSSAAANHFEACEFAWQTALMRAQLAMHKRLRRRFPDPKKWLWTDRSLAQASDWWTANFKASLFPQSERVADVCCGAGVDLVAISGRGPAVGIDSDDCLVLLAGANARAHGLNPELNVETVSAASEIPAQWLHIDPDRRPADRRTIQADSFSPSLTEILSLASQAKGAVVKLAPSTQLTPQLDNRVTTECDRIWLGCYGECRQQVLLTGLLRQREPGMRSALLLAPNENQAEQLGSGCFICIEYVGLCETADVVDEHRQYVYDLHNVLHASSLHASWASTHQLQAISSSSGYYTSDHLVHSPFAQAFKIRDTLPWDDRRVRRWLHKNRIREVEVKSRNCRIDASAFQKKYSRDTGDHNVTLLVTEIAGKIRALVAARV
ncbi:MAG: hypothetical protein KDB22_15220 [Planctomycetales bacterium]|nr:hypothetical protein [Planctomycetales bacterium]